MIVLIILIALLGDSLLTSCVTCPAGRSGQTVQVLDWTAHDGHLQTDAASGRQSCVPLQHGCSSELRPSRVAECFPTGAHVCMITTFLFCANEETVNFCFHDRNDCILKPTHAKVNLINMIVVLLTK